MTRILIRRAELRRRVPYSDVQIWRMERAGKFPHRVQLGPRAVAWYEDEVEAWCASRIRGGAHRPPAPRRVAQTDDSPRAVDPLQLLRAAPRR
jgi:prophage regulatory protein